MGCRIAVLTVLAFFFFFFEKRVVLASWLDSDGSATSTIGPKKEIGVRMCLN